MKQHLFDVKKDARKTNVIELNGSRFVEIAHHRPTPIFLAESLWLDFVEPLKKDKGTQETQLGSMLNEFDYAAFQGPKNPREGTLFFYAHLLAPFSSEMCFVAMKADVWGFKPRRSAVFLDSTLGFRWEVKSGESCESGG